MRKSSCVFAALLLACATRQGGLKDSRNQKSYGRAEIAGTVWMSENLEFPMSGAEPYNRVNGNSLVYNYAAASNACPNGWRLPTVKEIVALFSRYGKISYSGDKKEFEKIFGPYAPEQTALTYFKLVEDREMHFPAPGPDRVDGHRAMVWSSEKDEPGRAYAVYWRGIDQYIEHTSVHFSSYPVDYYGYVRCVLVR